MLLTMRSAVEEAYKAKEQNVSSIAQRMSKGALMGARGNSGVILSQIWRGMAKGMDKKDSLTGRDFAEAFSEAAKMAYMGLSNPVEGTILTVAKESAQAGQEFVASNGDDLIEVLEVIVTAANKSLANTPNLLPVLRDAGVVDAGGQGLYTILEGALRYLRGEGELMQFKKPQMVASNITTPTKMPSLSTKEVPYGYCTEFMLAGEELDQDKLRRRLDKKGESLIVVGDKDTIRVHIHTIDPGKIIHMATELGTLHQVSIRNMDEQYEDYMAMQKQKLPTYDVAVVTVVPGTGLADVFSSLGAMVVSGGQTMNPSTKDLLQAVESVLSDKVIILPNNKNIILTANQVHTLTDKTVKVVPTKTIPQGVAALLALDYEADYDVNVKTMDKARAAVRTIEITRAIRSTKMGDMKIKKNQAIGLLDTDLVAVGNDAMDVLNQVISEVAIDEAEVVTIYYGQNIVEEDAQKVSEYLKTKYPDIQIEVVNGGQPHYDYIISIE